MHPSSFGPRHLFGGAAVLLTATLASAQIDVAVCAAESTTTCHTTDVQTRLTATGLFNSVGIINVTTAGGGTPTLAQLQAYDAVICWTNSTPANNVTWGDVLADYVDAGGGVVVAVFANSTTTAGRNIGGRWQNAYEVIMDQGGNASGANHTIGTVHAPWHPLMAGVTTFVGGSVASRPNATALSAGSTLIAEWQNGKVLVAAGANPRRVDLGFFPPHTSCSGSGWAVGGDLLMANALLCVGQGASYGSFGAGCPGSLGVPTLAAIPGSRPVLGGSLNLIANNIAFNAAIVATGFSATMSGPFPLPLNLTPFGLIGCTLYADPLFNTFLAGAGNSVSLTLVVPPDPNLLGLAFFNQAFSFDTVPGGFALSNAATGKVGN